VFGLLVEAKVIDPHGSIFRMARALNVTPTKAKGLLFQHQLRTMKKTKVVSESQLRVAIEKTATSAATEALKKVGTAAATHGLSAIGGLFSGGGADALAHVIHHLG